MLDPNAFRAQIRYDPLTKKGSVLDVVQLVTDCRKDNVSTLYTRICNEYPDVSTKCANFKFPGQGQRPTPVAHISTLIEIAWLCPGKRAKEFRRTGAVTMCRALGGDLSLVEEIRQRHGEVAGTEEQAAFLAGTGVTLTTLSRHKVPRSSLGRSPFAHHRQQARRRQRQQAFGGRRDRCLGSCMQRYDFTLTQCNTRFANRQTGEGRTFHYTRITVEVDELETADA